MISVRRLRCRPKLAGVVGNGVVFAASGCCEARWIYAEVVLQHLHYRRCAECGEQFPVVAYVGAGYGHIVGIAFHKHVVVPVVLYYLGNLAEGLHGALVHLVAAALEEHIVGQRYVYHALKHAHVHLVQLVARQGAGKVGRSGARLSESLLLLACTRLLDVLVGRVDFVHELRYVDIAPECFAECSCRGSSAARCSLL